MRHFLPDAPSKQFARFFYGELIFWDALYLATQFRQVPLTGTDAIVPDELTRGIRTSAAT